ncbi:glycoside hydrolase family 108 protein [Bacteroides xylanisolvens]|uniref:glycoside hydrolase family 108 protein n=1 Tax=Bacteroides xylanisolvens TaxID=371601 RepID=UPI001C37B253|nr:glycosyl hydrolase 108 family protein [Bacteroides xylanisolvens]MBV3619395.1 peptidoglycan domain protein [Bacteroides xylanisolvens]
MANIKVLVPFILSWEGGFVNDPDDKGGATNKGVTIATWKKVGYDKDGDGDIDVDDLRLLSPADMEKCVLKPHYWDRCQADAIQSQDIANILVDWVWASGAWGIKYTQEVLGINADGIVGPKTIAAINAANPEELFHKIWNRREQHFRACASKPGQAKFLKGWLRRLDGIRYGKLILNV